MAFWPFSNEPINKFTKTLAHPLAKRYPPALDINPEKKISQARLVKVLEETLGQAVEFQRNHKLRHVREGEGSATSSSDS